MEPTSSRDKGGTIQAELSRELGLVSALAIGVGTMIAAGIFTLSGLAVGYVGSAAVLAFLIAALVATFTALTYCEFTSLYPESGEGYLYARRTFPAPLAYLVGWCLLLGYTSSCGFYIASLSSYFNEFVWHMPIEQGAGLLSLAVLTLLNMKGTKESGSVQVVVTVGKILLLLWFIGGGIGHVTMELLVERFSTDVFRIGSTAAMVFITFFGFSAIAASAGEVRNPTKTIPRAIFISMGIVTILYTLVVLVVVAANLSDYSEAAMGTAARNFLGPIGGMVIVGGAIFSMLSASNASIMAGSRVALSMANLGHLPDFIGRINKRTRTPITALVLTGTAMGIFALLLPLEELAHFADCVLLVALILVNAALIRHRRLFPGLARPFRVPLVPLLPGLGILANLYLLTQIPHLRPVLLAGGALVLGLVGYLVWKGAQPVEKTLPGEPSRVALERASTEEARFRVLIPIANPANVEALFEIAGRIASRRDGELLVLRVITVPEQTSPSLDDEIIEREGALLEDVRRLGRAKGVRVSTLVRVGHSAGKAILETARERRCDLIVLGWKGFTSTARRILGEVTDEVIGRSPCDIMLIKLGTQTGFSRLLLPSAGGANAKRAEDYALDLIDPEGARITLCSVIPINAPEEHLASEKNRLKAACRRLLEKESSRASFSVDIDVIEHSSVTTALVEAGERHDLMLIGAAEQSLSKTMILGNVPEHVARGSHRTVIVVKRFHPVSSLLQRVMRE